MDAIDSFEAKILKRMNDAVDKANASTIKEILPKYTKDIEDTFKGAAMEWYGHYTPEYYSRNHSLYNLVRITSNIQTGEFKVEISDDEMTKDRHGGSLFDKVVVQGWHGGAPDESGVIRYRAPYPTYTHWGRPAVRTTSALELFDQKTQDLIDEYTEIRNQTFLKYFIRYFY